VDDDELLACYEQTFGLAPGIVGIAQVRHHLELEQRLTAELLASSPDERWDTFARCYNRLYAELPWLTDRSSVTDADAWSALIGLPGARVYEVGSGTGSLASALAQQGYIVTATDISRERGARGRVEGLEWGVTDGVHLDRFATPGAFDAVISNQVIEHLHPADLPEHLRSARALLAPNGRYVFCTPHRLTGPHDVSKVFGADAPAGMHLREYSNFELARAARTAGFRRVRSVSYSPRVLARPIVSRAHLWLLESIEFLLFRLPRKYARRVTSKFRGPLRLDVFLVADA
jgi:SAM-dependent methyltransferase